MVEGDTIAFAFLLNNVTTKFDPYYFLRSIVITTQSVLVAIDDEVSQTRSSYTQILLYSFDDYGW